MADYGGIATIDDARKALAEKRYQDAITVLSDINAATPDNEQIISLLGVTYAEMKDYTHAMRYLSKALELNPTAKGHFNIAALHQIQGDIENAKTSLREALRLEPGYQNAAQMLARIQASTPAPAPTLTTVAVSAAPAAPEPTVMGIDAQISQPYITPTPQGASLPYASTVSKGDSRNWPKVILGGFMVGFSGLILCYSWGSFLSGFIGVFGYLIALGLIVYYAKWLSDSAGAYEIQHWLVMIFLTGLIMSLIMAKGFDILAAGWYETR